MQTFEKLQELDVTEFMYYQKDVSQKKSRHQRKQEKIEKLKHDMEDPDMKRERHRIRRQQDKNKLQRQLAGMTQEQARVYLDARKEKKKQAKEKILHALKTNGQLIMVDMVYEKQMSEKQNKSLAIQVQLIMKCIRHLQSPPGIHLCSVGGAVEKQLQKMSYHYWTLESHKEDIKEIGQRVGKKLVYLSPDGPKPLEQVREDTAYIIGGLVDRTVIKYASLMRAEELGIEARYLPIREFMKNRTCLNLDHVVMIISKFKQCGSWKQAFEYGAPKRWKRNQNEYGIRKVNQSDYEDSQNHQQKEQEKPSQQQNETQQRTYNKQQTSNNQQSTQPNKESSSIEKAVE